MRPRGILKDVLTVYVCFKMLLIGVFGSPFSFAFGLLVAFLAAFSLWFLVERTGALG